MLLAQGLDLRGSQAGVAEHAALGQQVAEVARRQPGVQHVVEGAAHRQHALPHACEFDFPVGAQGRVGEHRRDDLATVDRRTRVVATHRELELAEDVDRLRRIRADDAQRAAALAVETHALRKRIGNEERDTRRGKRPHGVGIGLDAVAEALVGQVEVGDQPALAQQRDQDVPLATAEVDTGRVVAAGMEQHGAFGRQTRERVQHAVEVQTAGRGIEVRVGVDRQPGALEHRAVVVPGRVADPDRAAGKEAIDEVGTDLQAAARADRLDGRDPAGGHRLVRGTEQQRLHRGAEVRCAFNRQIGLRGPAAANDSLGAANRGHDRDAAFVVEVDADAQVDLVRTRIFLEVLVEAQDRVAREVRNVLEHGGRAGQGRGRGDGGAGRPQAASAASMSALSDSGLSVGA